MVSNSFKLNGGAAVFIPKTQVSQPPVVYTKADIACVPPWPPQQSTFQFRWPPTNKGQQSEMTYEFTNWEALRAIAKHISGRDCQYESEGYHEGGRHIVRRIVFTEGGEEWLARVPIMQVSSIYSTGDIKWWWGEKETLDMESEIATMSFIAKFTEIPVPIVYGYNSCMNDNIVYSPYMLMQCMKGNTSRDLLRNPENDTEESRWKVRNIMAWIQCQLATLSVPKIGSLIMTENGLFDISTLPGSFGFQGPFTSTSDYLLSWTNSATFGEAAGECVGPTPYVEYAHFITRIALEFQSHLQVAIIKNKFAIDSTPNEGRYYIIHPDLHPGNVLFDDDWNLVGVIDWEFAYTAPLDVFVIKTLGRFYGDTTEEPGKSYLEDIKRHEAKMGMGTKVSGSFGSTLGELTRIMSDFESGRANSLIGAVERFENGLS